MAILGTRLARKSSSFVTETSSRSPSWPQQIIAAGFASGLPDEAKKFFRIHVPSVDSANPVLISLGTLRSAVVAADQRLADCPNDANIKRSNAVMADAKDFITSPTKTDGTKPSLLDFAVRRAALSQDKITYTLLLTRDVSGGGVSAIKPNWFSSVALLMGPADGITYQLVDLNGEVIVAGMETDKWIDRCEIDNWTQAFDACTPPPPPPTPTQLLPPPSKS